MDHKQKQLWEKIIESSYDHSSPRLQQLAALVMGHQCWHLASVYTSKPQQGKLPRACLWGETRRTPWNSTLGIGACGAKQMRMTFLNPPNAHSGNLVIWYISLLNLSRTRHIPMPPSPITLEELVEEMHIHNDIIIPGFQVIKRGISVLAWTSCPTRAPPHVPLESLVTWPPQTALDMCWPLSQGSEVLSGTVLREVNTYTKIPQRRAGAGHTAGALQQPKNGRGMTSSQGHEHRGTSDLVTSERPKSEGTCKF